LSIKKIKENFQREKSRYLNIYNYFVGSESEKEEFENYSNGRIE